MRVRKTQGLTAALPPATYADSTNVANFARAAEAFYNDPNNNYTVVGTDDPEEYANSFRNLNWSDLVRELHKETEVYNNVPPSTWDSDVEKVNRVFNTNITADDFIRDVSNPYQVSPPDILDGHYNSFFNPRAPDPIFDSRITPETIIYYDGQEDATDIPSYDPIMVTPWQDLTKDERQERLDKAVRTGNFGGIPQQAIHTARNQGVGSSGQPIMKKTSRRLTPITSSNTGLFTMGNFEMPSLAPGQIPTEAMMERELAPMMRTKHRGREPQTIYKQDPEVSTGQYPVGEYTWDEDNKRWVRRMWDKEMQRDSRELAIPRQNRLRSIETPPGGFMNGGKIKVKKKC